MTIGQGRTEQDMMKLKYTLVFVFIIVTTELLSKPISKEEILIQITTLTPSADPNAIEKTTPKLNLEWICNKSCQERKRLWELLLETNK